MSTLCNSEIVPFLTPWRLFTTKSEEQRKWSKACQPPVLICEHLKRPRERCFARTDERTNDGPCSHSTSRLNDKLLPISH